MSSNHHDEDDYSSNIDDQLLSVAKQEGVGIHHHQADVTSDHLSHAAAAVAALNDRSAQQQHQGHKSGQDNRSRAQHQQNVQNVQQQQSSSGQNSQDSFKKQFQQLQHQQLQQHHQQHQQLQQQPQHLHHQQHHNQIAPELHHHYAQADELDSEYNIQIPEPIVDSKSKIYPVAENTITAEGNLITRPFPEQAFHQRDDLNEFIQEFARDNGFGVVIAHSNKKAIYYTCELGGRYRHKKSKKDLEEQRQVDVGGGYLLDPNTKTKKLRCPFSMTASYKKSTGVWTLRTTCNEHNHPQLDPLSNHPMLRKRSDELNLLILDLYKVGTKPSHIESKIKEQFPDVLIKREDIYNEIRGYKRKLKKQNARYSLGHNSNRLNQYKKRVAAGNSGNDDAVSAAAVAAAAAANAILNGTNDEEQGPDSQVLQYSQSQQQQQEEFQRQFNEVAQHQLDDQQYQQYQHLQEHALNDTDNTAAVAIAAVARHNSHNPYHHNDGTDLSMDNIDSRLVGE
ncbi:uncharacterized protein RJT20DRAFT_128756 [Scheffersomyces xylosifermentans]|uniref:uncharacterized protein n=1 Tax=Scheffersomyces xylosifermentans TaxID=1304137 RepID=UPI00315C5E23